MTRGRNICNTLKAIRKQIADANGIEYSPEECHFKGECKGTCPRCEQDVRDLEHELRIRQMAGKAIKVAGIAAGLVAMTACADGKSQRNSSDATTEDSVLVEQDSIDPRFINGKIDHTRPIKQVYVKKFTPPEGLKEGETPNRTSNVEATRLPNSKNKTSSKKSKQGKTAIIQPAIGADSTESREIFGMAEEMPVFPGGPTALMKYIKDNIRYPEECQEGAATGRVIVGFTVNEDGSLSDVKVMRSVSPPIDNEAIRVVKSMPKWTPGKLNGKVVKVKYTVPVIFYP